jgi:hypothetical protein
MRGVHTALIASACAWRKRALYFVPLLGILVSACSASQQPFLAAKQSQPTLIRTGPPPSVNEPSEPKIASGPPQAPPSASPQDRAAHFAITVSGGVYPTITGSTNLPDGTRLAIDIKKPWLPDGTQRIARGLPACGDNECFPANGPDGGMGVLVRVQSGSFVAGPFSFRGTPLEPGNYPLEISYGPLITEVPIEQLRAIGTVLFATTIYVPADGARYGSVPEPTGPSPRR